MSLPEKSLPHAIPGLESTVHSCNHCSHKPFKRNRSDKNLHLIHSYDAAAKGFRQGCAFFLSCFPEWRQKIPPRSRLSKKVLRISLILSRYDVAQIWKNGVLWKQIRYFTFHDDVASVYIRSRPIESSPGSTESFDKVNQWIEACKARHTMCKAPLRQHPTRVIDLGLDEATPPRLCQLEHNSSSHGGYICLSYCWGGEQPVQLTKANITEWSNGKGIPVHSLPQTLQDAITVARKTHRRFLWIDSLCIVQDDPDDVGKEISLMPAIYAGAWFTILASRAKGCREGFLHERDFGPQSESLVSLRVHLEKESINLTEIPEAQDQIGSVILSMQFPSGMLSSHLPEPVESRAWILQEQVLSHKVLSYGTKVTYWTCRERNESDSSDPRSPFASSGMDKLSVNLVTKDPGLAWITIVEDFTKRYLSLPKDRVYAISGVAQEFNRHMNTRYFAGMWESMFPNALLWRMAPDAELLPRSRDYPAPTWSWMSIHGAVVFPGSVFSKYTTLKPSIRMVESKMNPTSESAEYGGSRHSYIRIYGRLLKAYWTNNRSQVERCNTAWWRYDSERIISKDAVPDCSSQEPENQLDPEVWLLPVIADDFKALHVEIHGLILTQTPSATFQRAGAFSYNVKDRSEVSHEIFGTAKREIIIY